MADIHFSQVCRFSRKKKLKSKQKNVHSLTVIRFRGQRTHRPAKAIFPAAFVYGWDLRSAFTVSLWVTVSTGATGLIGVKQRNSVWVWHVVRCIELAPFFSTPAAVLPPRRHESSRLQAGVHGSSTAWCPLFSENVEDTRCDCATFASTLIPRACAVKERQDTFFFFKCT